MHSFHCWCSARIMWTRITFLFLALAAASAEYGWKSGQQYTYDVTSTTITTLQTSPQSSGLVLRAQLVILTKSEHELAAVIEHAEKAKVHSLLQKDRELEIPKDGLQFEPFTHSKQSFIIRLKEGIIDELLVSREVPIWEVNIIRSIVSQLQVNTQGRRLIPSKLNTVPQHENEVMAVYKVIEDTVEGECEVLYDITPLPKYMLQRQPQLAPLFEMVDEENMINIVKTKNFSNCHQKPGFHYGITSMTPWKPTSNKMGDFLSRSSVTRTIISGNLKEYTIHSSETTNAVILSPELYNHEKGYVCSRVNLTLISVKPADRGIEEPANTQTIKKLVYDYNSPSVNDQEARQKWDRRNEVGAVDAMKKKSTYEYSKYLVNKITSDSSSSESSSVSTEDWHQETPKMDSAPEISFQPYFVGCSGHSIAKCQNINVNQVVKKLCEQIGQQLEEPSVIAQTNTLERFSILVKVIRTMNAKQLLLASDEVFVGKETKTDATFDPRRSSWMAFRDAVVQAGTGPALVTIKNWIINGRINGEEAAQVVAPLYKTALHPTAEYLNTFFTLVKDSKVVSQEFLNTSAIYSFTNLVRMAQVDHRTIHKRYPVHTFGRLTQVTDNTVVGEYIPYFAQKLEQAMEEGESRRIQVYIMALGNIAHPKILNVFEPYLEGKKPMSDFQRTLVIVSLNNLARIHPRIARSVLYKTYNNVGEVYQVRVAAVYNLMRTVPPVNMLQRMAESTHMDPSIQVRSAIKSAIESASLLKDPINSKLRKNAQAAVNMLTPEVFGVHYSRRNITHFVLQGLNLAHTDVFEYIGSEDSIFPTSVFYGLKSEMGTFQRRFMKFGVMLSSVQDLVDLFDLTYTVNEQVLKERTGRNEEWSYEKVTEKLNLEHEHSKKFEGNLIYNMAGAERFFSFDNRTIESVLEKLIDMPYELVSGYAFNYQKLFNRYTVQLGFPTATGLPFVYSLEIPTLHIARGKLHLKGEKPQKSTTGKINMMSEMTQFGSALSVQGTYSYRVQPELGFVTPFDHQQYIAGLYEHFQINIPIKIEGEINFSENRLKLEVEPYEKRGDLRIFHYESKQYTSVKDITDFKPITEGSNTKIIKVHEPQKYEHVFGENAGLPIRVHVETDKRHLNFKTLQEMYTRHNVISPFMFTMAKEKIGNTRIDVHFDKAITKTIAVTMGYHGVHKNRQNVEGKHKTHVDMPGAVKEILTKLQTGMKSPEAMVYYLGVDIKGQRNMVHSVSMGHGYSPIDRQNKVLVHYQRTGDQPLELCFNSATKMSSTPETDLVKAFENQPKGQVGAELRFGEKCESGAHITLAGKFERTPERVEYLKKLPQVINCQHEMRDGNKLLSACTNATFNANLYNRYIFTVKHDNVPLPVKNMTYQVYSFLRHLGYEYVTEKVTMPQNLDGHKTEVDVHFHPDLKTVDVLLSSSAGVAHFSDVRVNKYFRSVFVMHPTWNMVERFGWSSLRQQYNSYCTVDKTRVKTFDNATYSVHLSDHWTTVFITVPKIDQEGKLSGVHKVSVFSKETSEKNKEVIVISEGNTNQFSIRMYIKPTTGNVAGTINLNGQDIQVDDQQVYEYHTKNGVLIVRAFALPTGELKIIFPECNFHVLYDRVRVQVVADQIYKNRVLGLCGDYNGERHDFVTPKGKFLSDPEEFVATWTLTNEKPYSQLKERAERNSVHKTVTLTGVVSDQDAGRTDKRGRQYSKKQQQQGYYDSSSSSSSESTEHDTPCMSKRIMVIERDGKHCFSVDVQSACKSGCQVEKTKPMTSKFVCVNKTQTSSHWAQMVTRGAKPNLGEKVTNVQELTFQAPAECAKV